jgi:hypothetical protein
MVYYRCVVSHWASLNILLPVRFIIFMAIHGLNAPFDYLIYNKIHPEFYPHTPEHKRLTLSSRCGGWAFANRTPAAE